MTFSTPSKSYISEVNLRFSAVDFDFTTDDDTSPSLALQQEITTNILTNGIYFNRDSRLDESTDRDVLEDIAADEIEATCDWCVSGYVIDWDSTTVK